MKTIGNQNNIRIRYSKIITERVEKKNKFL